MTRKQMMKEIYDTFKARQGEAKAKWVYNQLRSDNKVSIQRTYNNLIVANAITYK